MCNFQAFFGPFRVDDEQRELRPRAAEGQARLTPQALRGSHVLASLIDSTKYRGKPVNSARVRCSVCRKSTRSYFVDGSDDSRGKYVAICRPGSKKMEYLCVIMSTKQLYKLFYRLPQRAFWWIIIIKISINLKSHTFFLSKKIFFSPLFFSHVCVCVCVCECKKRSYSTAQYY